MHLLIVFSHPFTDKYPTAVMDAFHQPFVDGGYSVDVLDLYQESFDPRFTSEDHAHFWGGPVPDEIAAMHRRVEKADRLAFIFPVYWWGMPAMMKGWIDRIFVYQQTYCQEARYECGRFTDKQALLAVTTGDPKCMYEPDGAHGDMLGVLKPIHRGVLAMTGFQVLPPFIAYEPAELSEQERIVLLDQYQSRLENITRDTPLSIPPFKN